MPALQVGKKLHVSPRCSAATLSTSPPWESIERTTKTRMIRITTEITTLRNKTRLLEIQRIKSSAHAGGGPPISFPEPPEPALKLKEVPPPAKKPKNHKKRWRQVSQKAPEIKDP